jgi:hypothetical protein
MDGSTMRTLGFRTHVLLTLLACGGLAVALGMPWFGPSPVGDPYLDSPMDRTLETIGRAVSATDGASGREALGAWALAIGGLAGFTVLMALLCLTRTAYGVAREGVRLGALTALALVAWRLVDHPGDELRQGALVAAAAALVLTASALSVASAPLRRRSGPRFGHPGVHVPPPPPPRYDRSGSAPPPGP